MYQIFIPSKCKLEVLVLCFFVSCALCQPISIRTSTRYQLRYYCCTYIAVVTIIFAFCYCAYYVFLRTRYVPRTRCVFILFLQQLLYEHASVNFGPTQPYLIPGLCSNPQPTTVTIILVPHQRRANRRSRGGCDRFFGSFSR